MSDKRKDNKGRILRTGESQRTDGRYMYRYKDLKNNRKCIYALDLNELRDQEKTINRDLEDGICTNADITLNQLFDAYFKAKTNLSLTTKENYKYMWKRYVSETSIGISSPENIKKSKVLSFYADLSNDGYKNRTIEQIHRLIFATLELAVDDDILRKNPAKNCGRDYCKAESKRQALTINQQKKFMDYVNKSEYKRHLNLFSFMLGTGCRISEVLGLTWDDIDFKNNLVHVKKQLIHRSVDGAMQYRIASTKTKSGVRSIPMSEQVRNSLLNQKIDKMFLSMSSGFVVDGFKGFVFVTGKGNPIQQHSLYLTIGRICREIQKNDSGFPNISAHIFRHTACTRMAEAGMDIKVLQEIMGHSNLEMIMEVYNHVQPSRMANEIAKIGDIVNM